MSNASTLENVLHKEMVHYRQLVICCEAIGFSGDCYRKLKCSLYIITYHLLTIIMNILGLVASMVWSLALLEYIIIQYFHKDEGVRKKIK